MATALKTTSNSATAEPAKLSVAPTVNDPQVTRFLAGGLASATAEIFTLPIDCTKVRLQAQRAVAVAPALATDVGVVPAPHQKAGYTGMLDAVRKIANEEGAGALWKGATPALMRQVSYTSICMVLYEPLRDFFGASSADKSEVPFVRRFLAGGFAGAIGISVANPYVGCRYVWHLWGFGGRQSCLITNAHACVQSGCDQGADAGRPLRHALPRRRRRDDQDLPSRGSARLPEGTLAV